MQTQYTYDILVNDIGIRERFFKNYTKLIHGLKKHGYNVSATKHAANKKRIAEAIALIN